MAGRGRGDRGAMDAGATRGFAELLLQQRVAHALDLAGVALHEVGQELQGSGERRVPQRLQENSVGSGHCALERATIYLDVSRPLVAEHAGLRKADLVQRDIALPLHELLLVVAGLPMPDEHNFRRPQKLV